MEEKDKIEELKEIRWPYLQNMVKIGYGGIMPTMPATLIGASIEDNISIKKADENEEILLEQNPTLTEYVTQEEYVQNIPQDIRFIDRRVDIMDSKGIITQQEQVDLTSIVNDYYSSQQNKLDSLRAEIPVDTWNSYQATQDVNTIGITNTYSLWLGAAVTGILTWKLIKNYFAGIKIDRQIEELENSNSQEE
jgi:hypothetical protein